MPFITQEGPLLSLFEIVLNHAKGLDWPRSTVLLHILYLPEFITVAQDEIHVFVKGLEGSDENTSILQDAPHPEVNVLQHLAAFSHRLKIDDITWHRYQGNSSTHKLHIKVSLLKLVAFPRFFDTNTRCKPKMFPLLTQKPLWF